MVDLRVTRSKIKCTRWMSNIHFLNSCSIPCMWVSAFLSPCMQPCILKPCMHKQLKTREYHISGNGHWRPLPVALFLGSPSSAQRRAWNKATKLVGFSAQVTIQLCSASDIDYLYWFQPCCPPVAEFLLLHNTRNHWGWVDSQSPQWP